jgi:protein tyrosine kinase modulator
MVRNGQIAIDDVLRVTRRYWWIIPLCVIACGTMAIGIAQVLPKKYTSQTVVLVSKPTVPTEYVKPVATEDLSHRLASMKEQILSRTRLEPVIERFDLYPKDRNKLHMEELVERLRTAIDVSPLAPMAGTEDRSMPGFSVSVTFENGQLAQQICTNITSMFMEQNASALEEQASRTTVFLSQQLDEAKSKLDEQDAKLARFKRQYMGSLPEDEQGNLALLATLNTRLDATTQALNRAEQDKAFNESLLNQHEMTRKEGVQSRDDGEKLQDRVRVLEQQLSTLEALYTPKHPDVLKKKSEIAELKEKIDEPPQVQQLRASVQQQQLGIASLIKRQAQIQEEIKGLQSRVQASPLVEQQLKESTRNYQTALDFYNELLKKRENSAMATSLAHQQEGEQFRVLDPPSLPATPSFPDRKKFAGGGLGGGLLLAAGILFLLISTDKTFHTEKDVELSLRVPVLVGIPMVEFTKGKQVASVVADSRG